MVERPAPAAADAHGELLRLRELLRQAELEIERLRVEAGTDPENSLLVEANQQLVLALLRGHAQARLPRPLAAAPAATPVVLADAGPRQGLMQEANEQLLLAALGAQDLRSVAERAQGDQTALLALVAHELRNPLTPIRMAAAILDRARADDLPRIRAVIERQVEHIARLVGDLLDISRVHTGKLRMQRVPMDACSLVPAILETSRPAIEARRQHLLVDVPAQPLWVDGDRVRLVQIVTNLLDNASKYTPDRGEIKLAFSSTPTELVITVSDTGIGIRAKAMPTVFHSFVQDSRATAFNGAGLGLGLAVVHELVNGHGGTVNAFSEGEGLGSRFVVTFPLLHEATTDADQA
jgi:signal transduction histidine kinase